MTHNFSIFCLQHLLFFRYLVKEMVLDKKIRWLFVCFCQTKGKFVSGSPVHKLHVCCLFIQPQWRGRFSVSHCSSAASDLSWRRRTPGTRTRPYIMHTAASPAESLFGMESGAELMACLQCHRAYVCVNGVKLPD